MRWDIFCRVIDNLGDIGVCWRLGAELAARGDTVRLWVDAPEPLAWMAPGALEGRWPGVQVLRWTEPLPAGLLQSLPPSDVWVEAFGCAIAPEFIARFADPARAADSRDLQNPVWLNLEYLSAEPWVERMHALPSPVLHGPAAGRTKWFFYPGFTPATGSLLQERDLLARQAEFDSAAWLARHSIAVADGARVVSLFCYEPAALAPLLRQWAAPGSAPVHLLVTHGRAAAHAEKISNEIGLQPLNGGRRQLSISYLPALPQTGYDELLWACGLNFVRGEDSLTRALWAGRPFVWQLYPQDDDAHHAKLEAFLDWLQAPATLRHFHRQWNGMEPPTAEVLAAAGDPATLADWAACAQAARQRLLTQVRAQGDLATRLARFVAEKR